MASHSSLALREISSAWCGKQTAISANKIQTKAHFVVGYVNPAAEDWLIAHVAHEEDDPCVRYMLRKFCFPSSPTAPPPLPVEDHAIEERRGAARRARIEARSRPPPAAPWSRELSIFFYCFRNLPLLGNLEFTPEIRLDTYHAW